MKWGVLALLLSTITATAGTPLVPPKKYDHPYYGLVTIFKFDKDNISKECSAVYNKPVRRDAAGCQFFDDKGCDIYLALKTKRAQVHEVLRHEIAHCNGWKHD